jgi:hypothetical protein
LHARRTAALSTISRLRQDLLPLNFVLKVLALLLLCNWWSIVGVDTLFSLLLR